MMTALFILIIVLALLGAPVFACMAGIAAIGASAISHGNHTPFYMAFAGELEDVLSHLATGNNASTLSTLPLFVFAGYLMAESKTAERLVAAAEAWLGWLPGGLAVVTIFACAFFTTVTGASGVTIVAIGGLMYPVLIKQKYKEKFTLGLVTSTGSIGLLFPPALPLIIFAIVYAMNAGAIAGPAATGHFQSEAFWYAGLFPGLLLVGAFVLYAIITAIRHKVPTRPFRWKGILKPTLRALPEMALPLIILVPIVKAWLVIPEAAAVAVLYLLILETCVFRDLKVKDLYRISREAMTLVGAIFVIIVAANALTYYFIYTEVPTKLYDGMRTYIHSKWTFLLGMNVLLLIVGCVMDIFSALLVVVPLLAPAAFRFGVDPYHLGVIFLINLEMGYLTPAVGLNMLISTFRFRKPMTEVYPACLPFLGLILGTLLIVTYLPLIVPGSLKLLHIGVKPPPPTPHALQHMLDTRVSAKIPMPDGTAWEESRCDAKELKDLDPSFPANCHSFFKAYAGCQTNARRHGAGGGPGRRRPRRRRRGTLRRRRSEVASPSPPLLSCQRPCAPRARCSAPCAPTSG